MSACLDVQDFQIKGALMKRRLLLVALAVSTSAAFAADVELKGWRPSNSQCRMMPGRGIDGGTAMGMTGEVGRSQRFYTWKAAPADLKTNGVYGMSFYVNRERSGSEILCRSEFHNLLIRGIDPGWRRIRTVMRMPTDKSKVSIALSDYNCQAETCFDRPRLVELEPHYRTESGIALGRGEVIAGNHYYFMSQDNSEAGCDTRTLTYLRSASSGDKFILKANSEVMHRFNVCGRNFLEGRGMLHVSYVKDLAVEVDASSNGVEWTHLALITNAVPCDLKFPQKLFPAKDLPV